jgi:MFS family permease
VASRFDDRRFGRFGIACFATSGVLWLAAIGIAWLPATALLLTLAFVPIGATNVLLSSLVQSVVPDRLLGRVSGLLGTATQAAVPVGSLLAGAGATVVDPSLVLGAGGVAVLGLAAYWVSHPRFRSIGPVADVETLAA